MAEILKFLYVLFSFISTPFVRRRPGPPNLRSYPCIRDKDCPRIRYQNNIRCRNGFCVDIS